MSRADDPAAAWTHLSDAVQALLDDPAVASSEITHEHLGTQTLEHAIGSIILGDVLIHTWDLARATGLDETLDAETVHTMLRDIEPMDYV